MYVASLADVYAGVCSLFTSSTSNDRYSAIMQPRYVK